MDRLLLLVTSTSYRAGAFLDAARALGLPVTVGTDRRQALAALHPEGHLTLDFRDVSRAVTEILAAARRDPITAIVAADDDGVLLAAHAAAELGLPHASVAAVSACRNKQLARRALFEAGIPTPRFEMIPVSSNAAAVAARIFYPCVLKPLFLSGSRGVLRADDPEQFVAAFRRVAALLSSPEVAEAGGDLAREILIEEYIPGAEVALEGLLGGGRLRTLAIFDKPDPLEGPTFEETIYVTPSRHAIALQEACSEMVLRSAVALGLDEGPVHAELRLAPGGPWPLEIAPRSIGGLCSRALRFGDGVSLEELILRHALGRGASDLERESVASGVMMIPIPGAGVLESVSGVDTARAVQDIEEIRMTIPVGQRLVPLPEGARYLGFIFARADSPERVEAALRAAHARLEFQIAPPEETDEGQEQGRMTATRKATTW